MNQEMTKMIKNLRDLQKCIKQLPCDSTYRDYIMALGLCGRIEGIISDAVIHDAKGTDECV